MDLTVEGKVFFKGEFKECCIGISDDKIVDVKKILKCENHKKFGNRLIIPTGIDIHTHFRDPGMTHKEDFSTGSMAAVYGGISCVFDMPNTRPQTNGLITLKEKIKIARKKSYVDFGIYAGVCENNIDELIKIGKICDGYKIFLGESTNSFNLDINKLPLIFKKILPTNKIILIHAESSECIEKNKRNEKNLMDHSKARPPECEINSIKTVLNIAKNFDSKIHFCHVSSIEGLNLIRNTQSNVSCGVTPHHSLLSYENDLKPQQLYKVNPPLRNSESSNYLLDNVLKGHVDVLESDHAPHTLDEKNQLFNDAPSGVPGIETMFPLFLYLAIKNKISFTRLISLLCSRPADIMNLHKGRIKKGNDADFMVVDYKKVSLIKDEDLHSKCNWTPFEGFKGIFPTNVFVRGESIIKDCEIIGTKGFGKHVNNDFP